MLPEFILHRTRGATTVSGTLEFWGIQSAVFEHNNLAVSGDDSLVVDIPILVDATMPFQKGDRIEVFDGTRRIFVGWAKRPKRSVSSQRESAQFTFESPWRFFQTTYFQSAPMAVYVGDVLDNTVYVDSPDVTLNRRYYEDGLGEPTTEPVTMQYQMDLLCAFAQARGNAGGAAPFDYSVIGVPPEYAPEQQVSSASVAAAMESVRTMLPALSWRWDYTTTLAGAAAVLGDDPVLRFVFLRTIDLTTGLAATPEFFGTGDPLEHTIAATAFLTFTPEPVDDLLVHTMHVQVISYTAVGTAELNLYQPTATTYTCTIENGAVRDQIIKLELRKAEWDGDSELWVEPETLTAPEKLPRMLMQGHDVPWVSFGATFHGDDMHYELRPTDTLGITGVGSDLETANAILHGIRRDLFSGVVTLTTGSPKARGMPDLQSSRALADKTSGNQQSKGGSSRNEKGQEKPFPGRGADGDAGLPALWNTPTITEDGGEPAAATTLDSAVTNTWDLEFKNIMALLHGTVIVGTTGGASNGSWAQTGTRTWQLSLYLNIPGITSVVVNVTTLDPGEDATGEVDFTGGVLTFDFGIPRGDTGETGAPGSASAYTAGTPGDWNAPAPTTIAAALDRLAAANPGA